VRADLVTWSRLVRTGFRRQSAYRLAMVAGLCTDVVFGVIRAAILFAALDSAGGSIAGYDQGSVGALTVGLTLPATAWPYVLGRPASSWGRRLEPAAAAGALAVQRFWVAAACLMGRLLMAAGHRKLVVQGG
jgi:ABC-type uncharacterized transport system permease subunit